MEFSRTTGHEKQKAMFERAAKNGRLAHSYAFVGAGNIGKTVFALDLARALGADPVMDVILFDGQEPLSVEMARSLQRRLALTPVGKIKVAIIARAEQMSVAVANLLLKTLEEPPAHSLLILTTVNFAALPLTLASRVQRVNFAAPAGGVARDAESDKHLEVLRAGGRRERMQAAEALAKLEPVEIGKFFVYAMRTLAAREQREAGLAEKLLRAWMDLRFHVNQKLSLDNLFLL